MSSISHNILEIWFYSQFFIFSFFLLFRICYLYFFWIGKLYFSQPPISSLFLFDFLLYFDYVKFFVQALVQILTQFWIQSQLESKYYWAILKDQPKVLYTFHKSLKFLHCRAKLWFSIDDLHLQYENNSW